MLAATDPGPEPPVVGDGNGLIDGSAGRYQILREIARGGWAPCSGAVTRTWDETWHSRSCSINIAAGPTW